MQKDGAATAGNARPRIVVDLDDEVIEMVVASQPVAGVAVGPSDRLIVVAIGWILAPGVIRSDDADGQAGLRPGMPVGTPPQPLRPKGAAWGAAVAFMFVSKDTAPTERHRYHAARGHQPAALLIPGRSANPDRGKRRVA